MSKNRRHIQEGINWLIRAQQASGDGGVAAWYSLVTGWHTSYLETTGYIISTLIEAAIYFKKPLLLKRALIMADFLTTMHHSSGGYRTHVPEVRAESPPTVFNTGQDLIGMTDIYRLTKNKKYLNSAVMAADFLISIQENDGSWLKYTYGKSVHTYHTRVAWGLLKVFQVSRQTKYREAALKNLDWAAQNQSINGWFAQNELPPPNPSLPYTHTISYAIEGFLESGILLADKKYIDIAAKTAWPLANIYLKKKWLPATFDQEWKSSDRYTCVTGDAQLAYVWLKLFQLTDKKEYFQAADQMLTYLKSTQNCETSNLNIRGGLKGSDPIYGDLWQNQGYCRMAYPNWAVKFYLDALFLYEKLRRSDTS